MLQQPVSLRCAAQILLEGVKLVDPIYWNLHIMQSDQVQLAPVLDLSCWTDASACCCTRLNNKPGLGAAERLTTAGQESAWHRKLGRQTDGAMVPRSSGA